MAQINLSKSGAAGISSPENGVIAIFANTADSGKLYYKYADGTTAPVDTGGGGGSGTSGTSGTSGAQGPAGTSGADGTSGTSGVAGTSGTSGSQGPAGTSGTSGAQGPAGTSGADGTSGTSGVAGTSGTSGAQGPAGTSGTSGSQGPAGTSGTSGVAGTSGTSGAQGPAGTSGTSGVAGTSGTSGAAGTSGTSGSGSSVTIQDDGTQITTDVQSINFTGAGVVLTEPTADNVTVTIAGGGGGGGVKQYAFLIQYGSNRQVSNAKGSVTQLTASPYSSDSVTITLSATTNELKLQFTTEDNPPQSVIGHYGAYAGYPSVKFNTIALNTGQNGYLVAEGVTATQSGGNADASDFIDDFSTVTYDLDVNPANYGGTEGADGFDTVFTQTYLVFSF